MKKEMLLIALASCLISSSLMSAETKFLLGFVSLADNRDVDIVNLPECRDSYNERATHVQIEVLKYDANLDSIRLTYQNGEVEYLRLGRFYNAGSRTQWVNLMGEARCVKSIRVTGESVTPGDEPFKQSQVLVYGLWSRD